MTVEDQHAFYGQRVPFSGRHSAVYGTVWRYRQAMANIKISHTSQKYSLTSYVIEQLYYTTV